MSGLSCLVKVPVAFVDVGYRLSHDRYVYDVHEAIANYVPTVVAQGHLTSVDSSGTSVAILAEICSIMPPAVLTRLSQLVLYCCSQC